MTVEKFIKKYLDYIPVELKPEFRSELRKLLSDSWLAGERSGYDFPRGEGS